jgi:hypothetical protein
MNKSNSFRSIKQGTPNIKIPGTKKSPSEELCPHMEC